MAFALRTLAVLLSVAVFTEHREAHAQLLTETTVAAGLSTDTAVATTQVRAFGEFRGWRVYGDTSFGLQRDSESDAFGAAYPYESKANLLELKAEKTHIKGRGLVGVRLGRYRTPFGISSGSDQGYVGFLRAPLIRNSYYWAISNNFLETGASITAGTTWLSAEVSSGTAADNDEYARPGGLNTVVRVQGSGGPVIVGASYIRTRPSKTREYATGSTEFTGVDFRVMSGGVQVRGEFLTGRPFDGTITRGGYADLLVHKQAMGPVTAVARVEYIDYFAGEYSEFPRRYTLGTKVQLNRWLTAQVNYVRRFRDSYASRPASLDISLSYTVRAGVLKDPRGF
jgi:hypothetical protein